MSLLARVSAALSIALSLSACLDPGDDLALDSEEADILNGDPIPSANSGLPMLTNGLSGCSGLLVDNQWVLTAAHCVDSYDDHGFSGDGQEMFKFAGQTSQNAKAIAVDSFGRAVVAGSVWDGTANRFGLARVRNNGTTDPYFASGAGRVTLSFPGADTAAATAVALDGSGRIVIAGWAHTTGGDVLALARYSSAGVLDPSFGGDGRVTTNVPLSTAEQVRGLVIDGQGRITVGGTARISSHAQWVLARYTSSGALDTGWNSTGIAITDFASTDDEYLAGLALDSTGKVVAVGTADEQIAVARYRTDGVLDATLDGDGKVLARHGGASSYGNAVAVDASDRIVVVGEGAASDGMLIARFTKSGALDSSFDGNGWTALSPKLTWSDGVGRAVAIDSIGRIVVAGTVSTSAYLNAYAVGRVEPSGALDTTFNTVNGVIASYAVDTAAGLSYEAFADGLGFDPDGNIYVSFELDGLSSTEGAFGVVHLFTEFGNVPAWPTLTATMGTQTVATQRVYRHGTYDAAMIKLAAPLTMNGKTTGYQFNGYSPSAPSTLVGKTLDCYGWGYNTTSGGFGTLRTANLKVSSASSTEYVLQPNAANQLVYRGDSGGPCFVDTGTKWLVAGITSYGSTATATQLAAPAFSAWATLVRAANP